MGFKLLDGGTRKLRVLAAEELLVEDDILIVEEGREDAAIMTLLCVLSLVLLCGLEQAGGGLEKRGAGGRQELQVNKPRSASGIS